jgi:energy-converting hydrogenase A subunit R
MKLICFDLEGPLSPQDNAYEVMGLIPDGHKVFEVISRYDDLLALEGRENYEPGDTLRLIVPFLLHHGISSSDIESVSQRAGLVKGAAELISRLKAQGWVIYIISTSYEQHALNIGRQVGVARENTFCTSLPLDAMRQDLKGKERAQLAESARYILEELYSEGLGEGEVDHLLKPYLDRFYWEELPRTGLGAIGGEMSVVGGRRKLWAVERIARRLGCFLEELCFVGDSITDAQAAKAIEAVGGLAIAFNGNSFVLPYATVGLATTDMLHLEPILAAWQEGGRARAKALVEAMPQPTDPEGPYYHWLVGRSQEEMEEIISIHGLLRRTVREEAGKLG